LQVHPEKLATFFLFLCDQNSTRHKCTPDFAID
jgi:hypothetical protein